MMNSPMVVTVDGTAGCGKSTLARKFAYRWNALYINSGLLYRSIGYRYIQEQGLEDRITQKSRFYPVPQLDDIITVPTLDELGERTVREILRAIEWDVCRTDDGGSVLLIDGRPPVAELFSEDIAAVASELAVFSEVRERCTTFQRDEATRYPRVVVEGRDAGTVVFPDAVGKWYVDAPLGVRAQRRINQLKRISPWQQVSLEAIASQIARRDTRDTTRAIAPQRPAEDAVIVDTFAEKQSDTLRAMEQLVRERVGW
jgi:cytidylate kinase